MNYLDIKKYLNIYFDDNIINEIQLFLIGDENSYNDEYYIKNKNNDEQSRK